MRKQLQKFCLNTWCKMLKNSEFMYVIENIDIKTEVQRVNDQTQKSNPESTTDN